MKILIAERIAKIREKIGRAAERVVPGLTIIMATDAAELHRALVAHPDLEVVLLDDDIIADDEEALFGHVRKAAKAAIICVLAAETNRERVLKAIYFGAIGIILKNKDSGRLAGDMTLLLSGRVVFPSHLIARGPAVALPDSPADEQRNRRSETLTQREREVIALIGRGQSVSRIASALSLSPHTVRVHVTNLMKKLDLRDRSALIHYAVISSREDAKATRPSSARY